MSFRLVWRNTTHQLWRTCLALAAISFAIVLLFMQLALYDACDISAHVLLDMLDFDAVVIGHEFSSIQRPGSFPRTRVYQAEGAPGVASVSAVYLAPLPWRNVDDGSRHPVLFLAVDPGDPVFVHREVRDQVRLLDQTDRVLMDRRVLPFYGPARVGLVSEAGSHTVQVAGIFSNGAGFGAGGLFVTSDQTFERLGFALDRPTLGLVRLKPGERLDARVADLRAQLPSDVHVLSRQELGAREAHYWTNVKPIGVMFSSGVYVGIVVAAVILYQVLASDISRRLREYATMKAIGYSDLQINWAVLQQALLLMILSFAIGLVLAFGLYALMAEGTGFPIALTVRRALLVFVLTLTIAGVSGFLALRKLRAADPADLF